MAAITISTAWKFILCCSHIYYGPLSLRLLALWLASPAWRAVRDNPRAATVWRFLAAASLACCLAFHNIFLDRPESLRNCRCVAKVLFHTTVYQNDISQQYIAGAAEVESQWLEKSFSINFILTFEYAFASAILSPECKQHPHPPKIDKRLINN